MICFQFHLQMDDRVRLRLMGKDGREEFAESPVQLMNCSIILEFAQHINVAFAVKASRIYE